MSGGVCVFVDQAAQDRFSADLLPFDVEHGGAGSVRFVVGDAPDQVPAARSRKPAAQDRVPDAPGERRPVAMTPYAIAVALFAAFVVGGILAKAVPLWLVAVIGLAIGAAVFVFVDRYPRLPRIR